MKILYHLISGQTSPNFITTRIFSPDLNIYFYTDDSKKQLGFLKNALPEIKSEEYCVDAFNYDCIRNNVIQLIKRFENEENILNFTGGTKVMSLAAFEVFKENNLKSIYIDSQSNPHKLITFENEKFHNNPYNMKMSIEEYLTLNGHKYVIKGSKLPELEKENRRKFYLYLENNLTDPIKKFLSEDVLNKFYPKSNSSQERNENTELISEDEKYKLYWDASDKKCKLILNNESFEISGNDSLKYITGFWFEDLVIEKKFSNNKFFDDFKKAIIIKDKNTNQDIIDIDIAAIKDDTLYIYELKSGKPRRDVVNNLKTIKEQMGRYVKPYVISYSSIPETDSLKQRFEDMNIKCYSYNEFDLNEAQEQINPNL